MIRIKKNKNSDPKNKKTIENLPNTLNPGFYRRCHLEMARKFTLKSQGGYIEFDNPNEKSERDDESIAASLRDDPSNEDSKRYFEKFILG